MTRKRGSAGIVLDFDTASGDTGGASGTGHGLGDTRHDVAIEDAGNNIVFRQRLGRGTFGNGLGRG